MSKKRILIICSASYSLIHFRGDFIKELLKNGYDVYAAAPNFREDIAEILVSIGAKPIAFKLQRTGLNPLKDLKTIFELKKIIKENKIDLVFPYTIKPVIYGSLAANFNKVPVISLITGLGFTFSGASKKAEILQKVTQFLYRISLSKNKIVIFQNSDDYQLFLEKRIITKSQKISIVGGSGVNLNRYKYRVNNNTSEEISFLIVARLIMEKGIELFLEAAEVLKEKYPATKFHVIGSPDKSPSAIKEERLISLNEQETIIYHGSQNNIQEHLYNGDVFVLPTFYREGIPRSILEALSVGLPIITTDSPGCKETVINYENGILIPPKNIDALIAAMEFFITNRSKLKEMGIKSRKYAEQKFDVSIINENLLKSINSELK
tara:strand:- start:544 stop:1680 length:1137 start_codon:yes stop_codon:yes gene_type:complete